MIKKFFAILLISSISFLAGSYYTLNNPPTNPLDWNNKSIFQDSVELFSVLPQNLEIAFDELKIILSDSIDFVDDKIANLLNQGNGGVKNDIVDNQNDNQNLLFEPADELQNVNLDYYFERNKEIVSEE
ncbi:hypothetical protein JFL43_07970 [Viridibacillus sp. YIM B01967]|uniref:Uncharacterized protein n=1 Tax=Viridibacillus soli TaxID=2798301 RepID=A0ABS1H5V5_9BACL|nr:hypothetical protein [Viridibacillus soli]MBK3494795.1 hypothetical protein [Viridibacillus soli]